MAPSPNHIMAAHPLHPRTLGATSSGAPLSGRISYGIVAITAFLILMALFARRALTARWKHFFRMPFLRILMFLVYICALCFVVSAALIFFTFGLDVADNCLGAIWICLIFYFTYKTLIYLYLIERGHVLRVCDVPARTRDYIWLFNLALLGLGFGAIGMSAFLRPVAGTDDGETMCRIGLKVSTTLPLLIFDIAMNIYVTGLFIYLARDYITWSKLKRPFRSPEPEIRETSPEPEVDETATESAKATAEQGAEIGRIARRSIVGCAGVLISTVSNLSLLYAFQGHEAAWLCYLACTCDVTWGILVLHWMTREITPSPSHIPSQSQSQSPSPSLDGEKQPRAPDTETSTSSLRSGFSPRWAPGAVAVDPRTKELPQTPAESRAQKPSPIDLRQARNRDSGFGRGPLSARTDASGELSSGLPPTTWL